MWCTTECWDCEDNKCEYYIYKRELYFENRRLKEQLQQKDKVIIDLLERIVNLEFEVEKKDKIINELEKELDLNLPFKVIGVRGLKNKLQELKGGVI